MGVTKQINLILIGPPGSGKGTQAARICGRYAVPMISTGDILRAAVKAGTRLGAQVQSVLSSGALVGDAMMIELVRDRLANPDTDPGFILDGFPRTIAQAEALETLVGSRPLRVIVLDVPEDELERRLTARRICSKCKTLTTSGSIYGSEEELCSKCGATLLTRDDDNIDVIRHRLLTYRTTTAPLIAYYQARGVLSTIDGTRNPDEVTATIFTLLEDKERRKSRR